MTPPARPAFGFGLRGYARAEVDAHVASTAAELAQLRDDLARAERDRDAAQTALAQAQRLREQDRQENQALVHLLQRQRDDALEAVGRLEQEAPTGTRAAALDPYPTHPLEAPSQARTALARVGSGGTTGAGVAAPAGPPASPAAGADVAARLERPRAGRPRADRSRPRWAVLVPLLLLLAAVTAAGVWWLTSANDTATGTAAATAAGMSSAPPAAPEQPREPLPPAVPPVPAQAAPLPDGWSTQRADDGSWTIGLPAGWTAVGQGQDRRFVSPSGLTTMWVRTARVAQPPSVEELEGYEAAYARQNPRYERLAAGPAEHRGHPAAVWEYVHGSGADQRRGSDLGVLVGDRGYWLHVESRASSWRFAEPLVERFQDTFVPS